jgi:alpha-tubulin suppressor-like RCC1 family protein
MGANLPFVDLGPGAVVQSLEVGGGHSCALFTNGSVKCWGSNGYGQLGYSNVTASGDDPGEMGTNLSFVDLGPDAVVQSLGLGETHSCAVMTNGSVKCWGDGANGRLGSGNVAPLGDLPNQMGANLPFVDLGPGAVAQSVCAGVSHTCALLTNGTVKCWGGNQYGQLGYGASDDSGDEPGEMGANLPFVLVL